MFFASCVLAAYFPFAGQLAVMADSISSHRAYPHVSGVGLAIWVSAPWQGSLVVGNRLFGSVHCHHLCLALPDGLQRLPLLRRQTLLTHLHG